MEFRELTAGLTGGLVAADDRISVVGPVGGVCGGTADDAATVAVLGVTG